MWVGLLFWVGWCTSGGFPVFSGVWAAAVCDYRSAARVLGLVSAVYVWCVRVGCSVVLDLIEFWCFGWYAASSDFWVVLLLGFSVAFGFV